MMIFFHYFRSKHKILNDLNACKSQRVADEKAYQATILNLETANDTLVEDMTVLSDEMLALNDINKKLRESNDTQLVYPYPTNNYIVKDYEWVWKILQKYDVKLSFIPLDRTFKIPPEEETIRFIQWDLTNERAYVPEDHDCDDFGIELWSNYRSLTGFRNMGSVLDNSGLHFYNMFVTQDEKLMVVEPQSDRVWEYEEKRMVKIYDAEHGYFTIG